MTRKEAERLTMQENTLLALGFTREEAEALRRISMTLHRWHELECGTDGGMIERDEKTGKPFWHSATRERIVSSGVSALKPFIPDREKGALKRLAKIIDRRNSEILFDSAWPRKVSTYIQTDPRGAALYLLRPGDVPAGQDAGAYYSRGICVY